MWIARGGLFWCWFQMATQGNSALCCRAVTPRLYQMRCLYAWAFWEVQWMWNCCKAALSHGVGMSTTAVTYCGPGVDHQHSRGTGTWTCWVWSWPLLPAWGLCTVSHRGIAHSFPRWWCRRWPHGIHEEMFHRTLEDFTARCDFARHAQKAETAPVCAEPNRFTKINGRLLQCMHLSFNNAAASVQTCWITWQDQNMCYARCAEWRSHIELNICCWHCAM